MASSKISGLASILWAALADGDEIPVVDKSDTSMAATGTNKKLTDLKSAVAAAIAAAVSAHEADTTSVHGVADTSALLTTSDAPELIRDTIGTALVAGSNITITPNDGADTITIAGSASASTGNGLGFQLASGYYPVYQQGVGTDTYAGDEIHFVPLILDADATADRIGIWVQTAAGAGKLCRLGIYNTANGRPTTVLLDAGTIAVDTTGVKEITISQALTAGTLYALAVHFEQVGSPFTTLYGQAGNVQTTANAVSDFATRSTIASRTFSLGFASSPTITSNGKKPPVIRVRLV